MGVSESVILYWLVYFFSTGLFLISKRAKRFRWFAFVMAVAVPVIFATMRNGVGSDYNTTLGFFKQYSPFSLGTFVKTSDAFHYATLYLFAKIGGYLGDFRVSFGLYSLVTLLPIFLIARKKYAAEIGATAVFVFLMSLFTDSFNGMRQCAAVAVCYWGIQYVYSRKFIRYCAVIAVAALLHTTAIIAFPIYFLWSGKRQGLPSIRVLLVVIVALILVLSYRDVTEDLIEHGLFTRFEIYLETGGEGSNREFFVHLAMFLGLLLVRKNMISADPKNALLYILLLLGLCMELIGFSAIFVKRISLYYFELPSIFLLAQLPSMFRKSDQKIVYAAVFLYAILMFVITYVILGHSDVLPYKI